MNGNLCRCATYHRIRDAIHKAAANLGRDSERSTRHHRPAASGRRPAQLRNQS
jgi:xanthine dehydrogenase iron-sulfur cluster and FAD-binding subunit A